MFTDRFVLIANYLWDAFMGALPLWSTLFAAALLSQTTGIPTELNALSATAILGWYAWHNSSRVIPGLIKTSSESGKTLVAEFKSETAELRSTFERTMALERERAQQESQAAIDRYRAGWLDASKLSAEPSEDPS